MLGKLLPKSDFIYTVIHFEHFRYINKIMKHEEQQASGILQDWYSVVLFLTLVVPNLKTCTHTGPLQISLDTPALPLDYWDY